VEWRERERERKREREREREREKERDTAVVDAVFAGHAPKPPPRAALAADK
jgi:hypothetical protein